MRFAPGTPPEVMAQATQSFMGPRTGVWNPEGLPVSRPETGMTPPPPTGGSGVPQMTPPPPLGTGSNVSGMLQSSPYDPFTSFPSSFGGGFGPRLSRMYGGYNSPFMGGGYSSPFMGGGFGSPYGGGYGGGYGSPYGGGFGSPYGGGFGGGMSPYGGGFNFLGGGFGSPFQSGFGSQMGGFGSPFGGGFNQGMMF